MRTIGRMFLAMVIGVFLVIFFQTSNPTGVLAAEYFDDYFMGAPYVEAGRATGYKGKYLAMKFYCGNGHVDDKYGCYINLVGGQKYYVRDGQKIFFSRNKKYWMLLEAAYHMEGNMLFHGNGQAVVINPEKTVLAEKLPCMTPIADDYVYRDAADCRPQITTVAGGLANISLPANCGVIPSKVVVDYDMYAGCCRDYYDFDPMGTAVPVRTNKETMAMFGYETIDNPSLLVDLPRAVIIKSAE